MPQKVKFIIEIQNGQKFWEIRNSWGDTGDNGYCKIAFSKLENRDYWVAVDIPINQDGQYVGGVVSFLPDNTISKVTNLFSKSTAGNLLQKSRAILSTGIVSYNSDEVNKTKTVKTNTAKNKTLHIVITSIVMIVIFILILFFIKF